MASSYTSRQINVDFKVNRYHITDAVRSKTQLTTLVAFVALKSKLLAYIALTLGVAEGFFGYNSQT